MKNPYICPLSAAPAFRKQPIDLKAAWSAEFINYTTGQWNSILKKILFVKDSYT